MNKSYRQGQILKLIDAGPIATQQELASALAKRGVRTTQVTLSRDLRELGLVKTPEGYARPGAIQGPLPGRDVASVAREILRDVRVAQNQLVLNTPPAYANSLASALDQSGWPEVVGTIAGDDTVLVITPDASTANRLKRKLLDLIG